MTKSMKRGAGWHGRPLARWLVLVACIFGGAAWAASSGRAAARGAFKRAQRDYTHQHYEAALRGYQTAYENAPLPAFLFDMAQCERKLGHWAKAEADYRRYLAAAPNASNRALTVTLADEMHAKAQLAALQKERAESSEVKQASAETHPAQRMASSPTPGPRAHSEAPTALEPKSAPSAASVALASHPSEAKKSKPIYEKWWFWTGIGVVAAGTATAIALSSGGSPAQASLGEINLR